MKAWIGIDNGVTGTIGVIKENGETFLIKTPVRLEQNYTKKKGNVSRVLVDELVDFLQNKTEGCDRVKCLIERPMVNPTRFSGSISAVRALEAVLIAVERLQFSFEYADSKKWQKMLLPIGTKGTEDLKKTSMDIGCRLFPQHSELIRKHKDADGMLIAEYCKRKDIV